MRKYLLSAVAASAVIAGSTAAWADAAAAKKWINDEFQPSTLTPDEQMAEMQWFIDAAAPYAGMEINVLSEGIPTHGYESEVLTKAFEEITGIKVNHQILGEGEVVQAVQTQMQTQRNLYDGYVNDSDLIGTHSRLQLAYPLSDMMAGPWADVTNPGLDLADFMGTSFTTGPDGKLYQLPDQQFANLYWFRKDWFDRQDLKDAFKAKYGYELGVPVNWSAYEDIAEFFTNDVKEVDGVPIYGHMDYGKRAPDLGWRMTDAWPAKATRANRTAAPSMNGASAWRKAPAILPVQASAGVAAPTAPRRSMRLPSGTNGCAIMPRRVRRPMTFTSRCQPCRRATSPSRYSGTRPLPPIW